MGTVDNVIFETLMIKKARAALKAADKEESRLHRMGPDYIDDATIYATYELRAQLRLAVRILRTYKDIT